MPGLDCVQENLDCQCVSPPCAPENKLQRDGGSRAASLPPGQERGDWGLHEEGEGSRQVEAPLSSEGVQGWNKVIFQLLSNPDQAVAL